MKINLKTIIKYYNKKKLKHINIMFYLFKMKNIYN
jgi:hypothetical protein